MVDVLFYPASYLANCVFGKNEKHSYKFVVILAKENGKFLFCRHKERETWEFPGGHIEHGENPTQAAKRELFEETGAIEFSIRSIFDYRVIRNDEVSDGVVFIADITKREDLPESEMAEVIALSQMPSELTYPQIQPLIMKQYNELL